MPELSPFGTHLRAHRKQRGLSQLDLALQAETTSRYVSFIETGRSRPGAGVVARIADVLELSLRARNTLFVAAGLPAPHSELALGDQALDPIHKIVRQLLDNHDPYPAMAIGPGFKIVHLNRTAERLFSGIRDMAVPDIIGRWFPGLTVDPKDITLPVITPVVLFDGQPVRTITTAMRFDKATDVTTSELVVELMFPADASAEAFFRARAARA